MPKKVEGPQKKDRAPVFVGGAGPIYALTVRRTINDQDPAVAGMKRG